MKLGLYLMNQKGFSCLKTFLKKSLNKDITYVVSAKDNKTSENYYEKIKEICKINNIIFYEKNEEIKRTERYKIAIGWRWIISEYKNLIVFHDSLLPKYRGFSPLVNMLINGEKEIGVTALFASKKYDNGDILGQKKIKISYPITIQEAIDLISCVYSELFLDIYNKILENSLITKKQNNAEASYSLWRDENDYRIDWNNSSKKIKRFIDAVGFPYKGASSSIDGKVIRILNAEIYSDLSIENRYNNLGKILFFEGYNPIIVCGTGLLKLLKIVDNLGNSLSIKFRTKFK